MGLAATAALVSAATGCGSSTEVITRTVTPAAVPTGALPAEANRPVVQRRVTPLQSVHAANADVRLELLSVERSGASVVTAHMRLVASGRVVDTTYYHEDGQDDNDFSGARMVDEVHAKQYLPLRDETGECLCTRNLDRLTYVDGAMDVSVKFPAPPPDVDRVSVQVPTFASFDAVALS
jgi:hypothetical protein